MRSGQTTQQESVAQPQTAFPSHGLHSQKETAQFPFQTAGPFNSTSFQAPGQHISHQPEYPGHVGFQSNPYAQPGNLNAQNYSQSQFGVPGLSSLSHQNDPQSRESQTLQQLNQAMDVLRNQYPNGQNNELLQQQANQANQSIPQQGMQGGIPAAGSMDAMSVLMALAQQVNAAKTPEPQVKPLNSGCMNM